jgi:integrase
MDVTTSRKPEAGILRVAQLILRYRTLAGHAVRQEDARHARWWVDQVGDLPIERLTESHILRQLLTLAKQGRSGSTQNFYLRFLRRVCAWGITVGDLQADPCCAIPLPKETIPALRVLTEDEEQALCQALGAPYALWVRFAIQTGLKQSEQFSLRWKDIDLDRATLLLPHASTGAVVTLQLSSDAVSVLRGLKQSQPPSIWVFPDFRNATRPVNIHAFYVGRWETAIERAGIAWCAWKDLRHTCGARLAKQGLPVREITGLLRQREVRMAYHYRAWQPGQAPRPRSAPRESGGLIFIDLTAETLQAMLGRDSTTEPLTFQEISHLYAAHHLGKRRGRLDFERMYRRFWQHWASRPADSVTRKEVRLWHAGLGQTPSHANHGVTYLKALYNWAIRMELVTCPNPAWGHLPFREYQRERFLSMEELQRFMDGLSYLPDKHRAYLLLLIMTGCRMGEARQMRWADLDQISRLWRKPRTKNGSSHVVPLPVQVMEAIRVLPTTSQWVFPGKNGAPWSEASAHKMWGLVRSRWNMDDVRLHDPEDLRELFSDSRGELAGDSIRLEPSEPSADQHLCPAQYEGDGSRLAGPSRSIL